MANCLHVRASTCMASLLACVTIILTPLSAQQHSLVSCRPASERVSPEGCWIIASQTLGKLPEGSVYWTIDAYPSRISAEQGKTGNGTIVDALGKSWLLSVGPRLDAPLRGSRITQIGPLPIQPGEAYTAQYMEAVLPPGAVSRTHLHSGPEAFYTETGESCLETPSGKQVGSKGKDIIIPEGTPMELVSTGKDMRRGLVLVLHASSQPATTVVQNWKSKGLCKTLN